MRTPTQLEVGTELPPLTKAPDRAQLVKFAAGSGDFKPLHYDADFPQARELGDNLVHGRLKYAALGQMVSDWLDHAVSYGGSRIPTGAWIASAMPSPAVGASSASASTTTRRSSIWSSGQRTPTVNTRPWGQPRSSSRADRVACGDPGGAHCLS
jgi:acyl dehydratase